MKIKVGGIDIVVINDGVNPALYSLQDDSTLISLHIRQNEMELLVATLQILVNQNKQKDTR